VVLTIADALLARESFVCSAFFHLSKRFRFS